MLTASQTHVRTLLRSQVQCVLATISADQTPHTALMAYAASPDFKIIHLATPLLARKSQNMIARPDVSLLWDNRTGTLNDHGDGLLVTARGRATLSKSADNARAAFLSTNPNMKEFLTSTHVSLFDVHVEMYESVVGYEQPQQWEVGAVTTL